MAILHLVRLALFGVVLLFSLIVLGISAHLLNISVTVDRFYFVFEALAVAVSVLTFFTVIPILVIDFIRKGAFTSLVAVELGWVFILMILWIAAAGETSATPLFIGGCGDYDARSQSNCHQFQAIQAFTWLNFLILFGWFITLVVSAAITHNRGHSGVWTAPVSDTAFFGHSAAPGPAGIHPGQPTGTGYPPQSHPSQMQQQGGYSQGYPSPAPPATQSYQGTPPPHHPPVAEV